MPNILTNLISLQSERYGGDRTAYCTPRPDGTWEEHSWLQLAEDVDHAAYALETLGMEPGDTFAIFSGNCAEIPTLDFACYRNRMVPVSIYSTSSAEQVRYILNDCGARIVAVGNARQYDIVRTILPDCPKIERIILFSKDIVPDEADEIAMPYPDLIKLGEAASAMCRQEVNHRTAQAEPDDIATLIYTSGTTGESKGAILPHSCFNACIEIHRERLTMLSDNDTSLCFLPLCHIFEKAWTYFCFYMGIKVYINPDPREIAKVIARVRPTCMCSVPRFWEKVYAAVQEKLSVASGVKKTMVLKALRVGAKRNLRYVRLGKKPPILLEMQYRFFDNKVLGPIRRAIGVDRGNIFPTAGAPLSDNIVEFLHAVGINIVVGYGLSETTATVSCYPDVDYRIGTVGTPLPGIEVRIGENNEIQVKGPTVMRGYLHRPEATEEAFTADGWFRTGDAGRFDDEGNLILTERIKDLFKTSNGKYIAPQAIESRLGEDRYIEQVAVIGDSRKYVTAIIIPAFEALKEYATRKKIAFRTVEDLVRNEEIRRFFDERIERLQRGLAGFEKIKKFTLLPREFTIENGELTNTLKLKRPVINSRYANEIEAMYA